MIIPDQEFFNECKSVRLMVWQERKALGFPRIEVAGMCNVGVRFMPELENGKIRKVLAA